MCLNFYVGDYIDTVIYDVLLMDACHLLLGRPWQYDHRATHEGRSNTYSFWDAGRRHVLQPMFANAIKEDDILSVKKKLPKATMQPRIASFQEGGDDVGIYGISEGSKTTTCKLDHANKKQIICVGRIPIQLVALDEVEPTFKTPCVARVMRVYKSSFIRFGRCEYSVSCYESNLCSFGLV